MPEKTNKLILYYTLLYYREISMATNRELESLLKKYVDYEDVDNDKLKQLLKSTRADIRAGLLMRVKSEHGSTAVYSSFLRNELELLKCMLDDLSIDQKYKLVSMQMSVFRETPVHWPSMQGDTDVVKYLLSGLTEHQIYNIIKIQDYKGNTPLHYAATNKHTDVVQYLLTSVSNEHRVELLTIYNNKKETVRDIGEFIYLLVFLY